MIVPQLVLERFENKTASVPTLSGRCKRPFARDIQFFFISIRTRNGPTGAPFNLSTCGLLQVVAKIWKFYLIPGLSKSDHYFSRNRPESKFGQFHNLTLDAMDHILCLRRQYQKIALESSIIKIDWHMIRHYKAYLVYYMFSSHLYYFDYFV